MAGRRAAFGDPSAPPRTARNGEYAGTSTRGERLTAWSLKAAPRPAIPSHLYRGFLFDT